MANELYEVGAWRELDPPPYRRQLDNEEAAGVVLAGGAAYVTAIYRTRWSTTGKDTTPGDRVPGLSAVVALSESKDDVTGETYRAAAVTWNMSSPPQSGTLEAEAAALVLTRAGKIAEEVNRHLRVSWQVTHETERAGK